MREKERREGAPTAECILCLHKFDTHACRKTIRWHSNLTTGINHACAYDDWLQKDCERADECAWTRGAEFVEPGGEIPSPRYSFATFQKWMSDTVFQWNRKSVTRDWNKLKIILQNSLLTRALNGSMTINSRHFVSFSLFLSSKKLIFISRVLLFAFGPKAATTR